MALTQHAHRESGPAQLPQFTVRSLLALLLVAAVVSAAIHYLMKEHERERRRQTANRFKLIGTCLTVFNAKHNRLPFPTRYGGGGPHYLPRINDPTAPPLYSWRFALGPCIESIKGGPAAYDKAWNSSDNRRWHARFPIYTYFDDISDPHRQDAIMLAVVGPGTAFGEEGSNDRIPLTDVPQDIVLIVEKAASDVHWMSPGDFDISSVPAGVVTAQQAGLSSRYAGGFHVVFADTTVWFLSENTPYTELKTFFTIDGSRKYDRNVVLREYILD